MSVPATSWVLTTAPVENPTELAVLWVLAERADERGRGVYYSHQTIAAYARSSVSTVQRTLAALERRGCIRRGDQSRVSHIQPRHRPVVWDLDVPERSVRLTPRQESDRSDQPERSVRSPESDRSQVTDDPRTNPRTTPWSAGQRDAFTSGQPVGCRRHGVRRPACDDCLRTGIGLDRVHRADTTERAKQARAAIRGT